MTKIAWYRSEANEALHDIVPARKTSGVFTEIEKRTILTWSLKMYFELYKQARIREVIYEAVTKEDFFQHFE